ncbi:MAG: NAD-dependent epimerase/dehydratase family protein, partial [Bryobacteraceae bacterium]
MQVLVTGGAGYIGSHTAKVLSQRGLGAVALDDLSNGHRHNVRWGPLVDASIADTARVRGAIREHRIEAVVHFAAKAYVGESMAHPDRYFRTNVAGTLALLDALREEGVSKLVFSSTCATYGIPQRVPIDEDHPQRPVNPYGESKLFVERVLDWYGKAYGLRSVALRYFNAAGADPDAEIGEEHDPETHLIPLV